MKFTSLSSNCASLRSSFVRFLRSLGNFLYYDGVELLVILRNM